MRQEKNENYKNNIVLLRPVWACFKLDRMGDLP